MKKNLGFLLKSLIVCFISAFLCSFLLHQLYTFLCSFLLQQFINVLFVHNSRLGKFYVFFFLLNKWNVWSQALPRLVLHSWFSHTIISCHAIWTRSSCSPPRCIIDAENASKTTKTDVEHNRHHQKHKNKYRNMSMVNSFM